MKETKEKGFDQRFEKMAESIDAVDELRMHFRHSAYEWLHGKYSDAVINEYFNQILETLFDLDLEFSERRELEMRTTINELLLNSGVACKETENKFIECECVIGKKGIAVKISDQGKGFDHEKEIAKRTLDTKGLTNERVLSNVEDNDYPGGTGIYCLLHFTQDFVHNEIGNKVALKFDL